MGLSECSCERAAIVNVAVLPVPDWACTSKSLPSAAGRIAWKELVSEAKRLQICKYLTPSEVLMTVYVRHPDWYPATVADGKGACLSRAVAVGVVTRSGAGQDGLFTNCCMTEGSSYPQA